MSLVRTIERKIARKPCVVPTFRVMPGFHFGDPYLHRMAQIDYSGIEISVMAAMGITVGPCVVCGRTIMSCDKLQHYRSHRDRGHMVAEVMES